MIELILASGSPRRQHFLRDLGLTFTIVVPDIDESQDDQEAPDVYVSRMAIEKARAVLPIDSKSEVRVLGADTVVVCDGEVLGKPLLPDVASSMLRLLSGKQHDVLGGMALLDGSGTVVQQAVSHTSVVFSALSDAAIAAYVATGEPLDKAGAYAIQGLGAQFVERIEGSYSNVVGLDLAVVTSWLRAEQVLE